MTTDARPLYPPGHVSPINWWSHLAGKLGCSSSWERPVLIGIRGVALGATETHETRSKATYDDTFILLAAGGVERFRGSSHAYQLFSKLSPDVNHDGVGDVATINPGLYRLTWKLDDAVGCPLFELTMPDGGKDIPARRDLNHDGALDGALEAGPFTANAVLFHTGYDRPEGAAHGSSIACQTTSLANLKLMKKAGHVLDYALVDAGRAMELLADFDDGLDEPTRVINPPPKDVA